MSEFGIKIKNMKAATLYGYNLGIRDRFDYTDAMFSKSLFSNYITKNGMKVTKGDTTRDIICLEFSFGSRSYDEDLAHIKDLIRKAADDDSRAKLEIIQERIESNNELYCKKNKEEIREYFYDEDVSVEYKKTNKKGEVISTETITYKMLYRNASKAKTGQVMFINEKLYDKAYDWITMGLGKKLPPDNAKIVEISAYAPLVTSTIVGTVHIPVGDILILKDQDSFFNTVVDIVKAEDYETVEHGEKVIRKKCVVERTRTDVKNTLWDGMAIVESDVFPEWINGMGLLRNHFFKTCGIRGYIQMFFQDWCEKNGYDYETYTVKDMFGVDHYLKDIKMITTDNSIKWKKFADLMGGTLLAAYKYWCDRINADGSVFGIVKTDHESKLGEVQQMSYQMVNTLPCTYDDVKELASTSIKYVELIKTDNEEFVKFLLKNKNEINNYEMIAALYYHNPDISKTKWFKTEKRKIINGYVNKLRKGKITINADNLTIFGNPYALLLYSVGEDFNNDPVFQHEDGCIQCYTRRFDADEYLAAFRNPHNSPNNVCYLHNVSSELMDKYFVFSPNIMAVNCIRTDIQDRANGCDFDSDFMFVTNNPVAVRCAKKCYKEYPTIVNKIKESGITYSNTKKEYARMDNKFARSQRYIGESSNLAQLAMTYYWTDRADHVEFSFRSKELYDNFVILAVLAQVVIDGCKREYEIDAPTEIERIKRLDCMTLIKPVMIDGKTKYIRCDFPRFMQYTKAVKKTKEGKPIPDDVYKKNKNRLKSRINDELICPMNYLEDCLDKIQGIPLEWSVDIKDFFIKLPGKSDTRQMSKIIKIVEEYDAYISMNYEKIDTDEGLISIVEETDKVIEKMKKMKITNLKTINRLIETSLNIETSFRDTRRYKESTKYTRKLLNLLFKSDKERFLNNFVRLK